MRSEDYGKRRIQRTGALFPWIVLLVSLSFTAVATMFVAVSIERRDYQRFQADIQRIQDDTTNRLATDTALITGVKGMFSQKDVPHGEFRNYVNGLDLADRFPGMTGIGFVGNTTYTDRQGLEAFLREYGVTGFKEHPAGINPKFEIMYIDPVSEDYADAPGFNMASDPKRLKAIERAAETGDVTLAGPLFLKERRTRANEPAFIIFAPLFYGRDNGLQLNDPAHFFGLLFAPVLAKEFVKPSRTERICVYMGDPSPENLLFDSANNTPIPASYASTYHSARIPAKDGSPLVFEFWTTPAFDALSYKWLIPFVAAAGLLFSGMLFYFTLLESVARRKAQQEASERLETQKELGLSERRLRNLIEQAPLSIQVISPDGYCKEVNGGFEKLWGLTIKDLEDVNFLENPYVKDSGILPYLMRALSGKPTVLPPTLFEASKLMGKGNTKWIAGSAYPLKDGQGRVREIVVMQQDLSDVKHAEEEIRRMNSFLEQRVEERTEELAVAMSEMEAFSYSVAHDLRAPLRAMGSFARILSEDYAGRLDGEAKNFLERIVENSIRMGELIDGLLDLSRISRATLDRDNVDLSAMAAEISSAIEKRQTSSRTRVKVQPGLHAEADARLIHSALQNLLENAWKFSQNAKQPLIEFGMEDKNSEQIYFVRDNGAGFDPSYVGKLFRPFERLHNADEYPGTGIGLATVKRIIERHGGRVWAQGDLGKGATFYFTLPITKPNLVVHENPSFYMAGGAVSASHDRQA